MARDHPVRTLAGDAGYGSAHRYDRQLTCETARGGEERMNWLRELGGLVNVELVRLGALSVTPVRIVATLTIVLAVWRIAIWIGHQCANRLLKHVASGPRYTIIRLMQYGLWTLAAFAALQVWSIDLTALAVVAGILGVGIGFGLQNLTANFVAGIVLLFEQPVQINDYVSTETTNGRVENISFRATTIVTNDNISIIVPNSEFVNRPVTNWSHGDPNVRLRVPVGVAYGSDASKVTQILVKVAYEVEHVLHDPKPRVHFTAFGDSALEFELLVWTDRPISHRTIRSHLHYGIYAAFDEAKIQIPFPQRDIHLRTLATPEGEQLLSRGEADEASRPTRSNLPK